MKKIKIAIILGSDSDLAVFSKAVKLLESFTVPFSVNIASAHRSPKLVKQRIAEAERAGAEVFIAGAGMAAALPGVVAAETILPVIGVPIEGKAFNALDALLSMVQMPPGIPVATVSAGKAGAVNAVILALRILALKDPVLRKKIQDHRKKLSDEVIAKDKMLSKKGIEKYILEHLK